MSSRRDFLRQCFAAGAAAHALSAGWLFAQQKSIPDAAPARIFADTRRTRPPLDRNLFGSFLEHLGRAIYDGIYQPGSPLSDASGFRTDVLREIRQMGVPIIRYPGGNFVSGYNWLDGVGPKRDRPAVLDKAWNTIDSNQFGTDEFLAWCKLAGAQPLMGLNLGTGTPEQAAALVEYCNVEKGTRWSDLRRQYGVAQPYNVTHWCLGNEMDGPWQIGHMSARDYGMKAADAARQMRYVDPSLKLVACGSSGPSMPTYLQWDQQVLEQCYDYVDAISLHRYFGNDGKTGGDSSRYLALNLEMERQIAQVAAVCDVVQARKRSPKKLWLSFDEWNVWYRATGGDGHRQQAPHLLEEVYNLEDALLVGGLINCLLRNSDRVRIACLAQLVNVIAPIVTSDTGLLLQTIFYPYNWALQYARGSVMDLLLQSPTYDVKDLGPVTYIDAAATLSAEQGRLTMFALNRDLSQPHQVEVVWEDKAPAQVLQSLILTGNDLKASNSFAQPRRVVPQDMEKPSTSRGRTRFELPARSYGVIQWSF